MKNTIGLKNRKLSRSISTSIMTLMLVMLIVFLVWGEINKAPNNEPNPNYVEALTNWTALNVDGKDMPITIPNSTVLAGHKDVTITTNLGEIPKQYNTLLVWSKGQKINVFFNGELWYTYDPTKVDSLGINSTYLYLFVPLPDNASYSNVTIEFDALLERDGGKIGDVLIGEQTACLLKVVTLNQLELFFGLFVLLLGFLALIIGTILHFVTKREVHLYYLACAVFVMAFWIVSNCRARQFVFPNASIIRDCAFLVLPLMSICFSVYLDRIQREKYHVFYLIIEAASFVNLVVISVLNYTGISGFSETRQGSLIMLVLTIVVAIVTIFYDLFKKKDRSYILVTIGLGAMILCGIIQLIMEQVLSLSVISGTFMSIGLIILVIFGLLQAVSQIRQMEDDRKEAIEEVEHLSRSAMEALAKTVDAKDRYTSGHSMRVAEVACLIAKELGWKRKRISELRFQGMMHDIGKIGVPDTVLNKPGKLSSIEFELIQSHTIVGSDILKNVSTIPGVEPAARHHHERYDGNGYPDHLKGEDIPLNARIIGIADAYDAMNSDRIYRKALPKEKIRAELIKGKGTQFDPKLIDVFVKLLDEDKVVVKESSEEYVIRNGEEFDSTEFNKELEAELGRILGEADLVDVERVKLGEITYIFRKLRNEYNANFQVIAFSIRVKDNVDLMEEYMDKAIESMDIAIQKSIREEDITKRYSKTQMLIVLFEVDPSSLNFIVQRILLDFYKLFDASPLDISYKIIDIDKEYKTGITMVQSV